MEKRQPEVPVVKVSSEVELWEAILGFMTPEMEEKVREEAESMGCGWGGPFPIAMPSEEE